MWMSLLFGLWSLYIYCLQDREFVEMDTTFQSNEKPSETPPPSPDPSLVHHNRRGSLTCCGKGLLKKKVRVALIALVSDTKILKHSL